VLREDYAEKNNEGDDDAVEVQGHLLYSLAISFSFSYLSPGDHPQHTQSMTLKVKKNKIKKNCTLCIIYIHTLPLPFSLLQLGRAM